MLGDKIKELRTNKKMFQQDLASAFSVSKSTIAMWETNKRVPDTSMLVKIADYFEVTVDYLLEEERRISAINRFGFCYTYEECERMKAESRNKISSGTLSDEETVNEAINIYKALFSRSLQSSGYSLQHIDFKNYCAMMLNQDQRQREIFGTMSDEKFKWLREELIGRYGQKPGISEGTYYKMNSPKITMKNKSNIDEELKFALFDGAEGVTDEMFEEVKQFASMVKMREDAKKEKK